MTCPNCGNRDLEQAKPRVSHLRGRRKRDDHARFEGWHCLRCGHDYDASPGTMLRDFDPPNNNMAATPAGKGETDG